MALHVYHELFVHLVWHTKSSAPLLTGSKEEDVHAFLLKRMKSTSELFLHALGGTENHIHLAVEYEPVLSVSEIVKDLKGACSREINQRWGRNSLVWQRGYGAVSFGKRNTPWVKEYIKNQKQHHREKSLHSRLECISFDDGVGEGEVSYGMIPV